MSFEMTQASSLKAQVRIKLFLDNFELLRQDAVVAFSVEMNLIRGETWDEVGLILLQTLACQENRLEIR